MEGKVSQNEILEEAHFFFLAFSYFLDFQECA